MEKYNNIINKLRDKLTNKLFNDPILADDGEIYERSSLIKYLKENNNKSPTYDDKQISYKFIKVHSIRELVDVFIDTFPILKKELYGVDNINENTKMLHCDCNFEVNLIFEEETYQDLLKYCQFDIQNILIKNLQNFINKPYSDIQKYFFDNINDININVMYNSGYYNIMNIIIRYNLKLFEYILFKYDNVDVNAYCPDDGNTILHQVAKYYRRPYNIVIRLIEKNVNLLCTNNDGETALMFVYKKCDYATVKYVFEHLPNQISNDMIQMFFTDIDTNDNFEAEEKETLINLVLLKLK